MRIRSKVGPVNQEHISLGSASLPVLLFSLPVSGMKKIRIAFNLEAMEGQVETAGLTNGSGNAVRHYNLLSVSLLAIAITNLPNWLPFFM